MKSNFGCFKIKPGITVTKLVMGYEESLKGIIEPIRDHVLTQHDIFLDNLLEAFKNNFEEKQ